jgi:hypothetical protein
VLLVDPVPRSHRGSSVLRSDSVSVSVDMASSSASSLAVGDDPVDATLSAGSVLVTGEQ